MNATSRTTTRRRADLPTPVAAALAVMAAAVVSVALSIPVARTAHAVGAADNFRPLSVGAYAPLIVVGLIGATMGWVVVRRRAQQPARVLGRLAPTVVLLSMIPDVLLGVTHSLPGTNWTGVIGLMFMHLVVAAAGIASLCWFLPTHRLPASSSTARSDRVLSIVN